jgi:hypothetical protein
MSGGCFVCGDPEIVTPHPMGSATCELHGTAHDHVISMRNDGAFCECGWSTDHGLRQHRARDRACKRHWLLVCEEVTA